MVFEVALLPEAKRRAYLDAMGVELYAARRPVTNAAESWWPLPEGEAKLGAAPVPTPPLPPGPPPSPPSPSGSPGVSTKRALDAPAIVKTAVDAPLRPSATNTNVGKPAADVSLDLAPGRLMPVTGGASGAALRFPVAVSVFEWPGRCRVLAQLRDGEAPSLDSREHALWNDLAQALAGREPPGFSSLPLFRFPPGRHHRQLATAEHLCDALRSLLQSRQSRVPVPHVLLYADAVLRDCLGDADGVMLLPSLKEMLGDWTLKRVAWLSMRTAILS